MNIHRVLILSEESGGREKQETRERETKEGGEEEKAKLGEGGVAEGRERAISKRMGRKGTLH